MKLLLKEGKQYLFHFFAPQLLALLTRNKFLQKKELQPRLKLFALSWKGSNLHFPDPESGVLPITPQDNILF